MTTLLDCGHRIVNLDCNSTECARCSIFGANQPCEKAVCQACVATANRSREGNPYLEAIIKLGIPTDLKRNPWLWMPEGGTGSTLKLMRHREVMVMIYAWAIPFEPALEMIRKYAPLIEIGAGNGYWAHMLKCDILCYDHQEEGKSWYLVEEGSHEKIVEYPDRTLFLCWPPYAKNMAMDCLRVYTGKHLVFIGEGDGGCTGDQEFWDTIDEKWESVEDVLLPQWWGIHDWLQVYRRKK